MKNILIRRKTKSKVFANMILTIEDDQTAGELTPRNHGF